MAMIQPEAGGGVSRPTSNPHAESVQAHLAAALGKPVWILSRFDNCWRWLLDRSDSPWYPTVRLYRQERYGDWNAVVQRVTTDLHQFFA